MEDDNVKIVSDYETEILFPPGAAGFALEPVVRNGTRAVGAKITSFLPSSDREVNLYRNSSPYPYPNTRSHFGDLASKHLAIGSIMQTIDDECVRNKSFDCIMTILHAKNDKYRRILFKNVEASWISGRTANQPTQELSGQFDNEFVYSSFQNDNIVVSTQPKAEARGDFTDSESEGESDSMNQSQDPVELNEEVTAEGQVAEKVDEQVSLSLDDIEVSESTNEENTNPNMNFNSSQSPKVTTARTSPPITASKRSPQVLALEDWLASPADGKNPFVATTDESCSMLQSPGAAKALFNERSMESVDLATPSKLSILSDEDERDKFEAFGDAIPMDSPSNASSIGTASSACPGCKTMATLEEMVASLLREKLGQAEEVERKEVAYSHSLKQANLRERELEESLALQSESFAKVMQATNEDAETIEALQLQLASLEESAQSMENASHSQHSEVSALRATIAEQKDELDRLYSLESQRELEKESFDKKEAMLEKEIANLKYQYEQAQLKLECNERTMRRDAEELRVAKSMAIGSSTSNRNIETIEEENRQLKLKVEILLYATVSRANVMNNSVTEADNEFGDESLTTDEAVSPSEGPSPVTSASPSTPLKIETTKVVASPGFDANSFLESMITEAAQEEILRDQNGHDIPVESTEVASESVIQTSSPSPFKINSRDVYTPPRTPSEQTSALQEMIDSLMAQKMAFMETEAKLKGEICDLEYAVKALAEDARCDEKALETALLDLGEAQQQSEELKDNLVDMESEYISKLTKLQSELKEALKAEDVITAVKAECNEKVAQLEEELLEMRNAMLEITQDDMSETPSLEEEDVNDRSCSQEVEEQEEQVMEEMSSTNASVVSDGSVHALTNILNICGAIDRNDLITRSPAGVLSVAAHMESIGRRYNNSQDIESFGPLTPSSKQAQSALRIWRKGQLESPSLTSPLKTPLKEIVSTEAITPQTAMVTHSMVTPRVQLIRTPLTAYNASSREFVSENRAWSTGRSRHVRNGDKYWLLAANTAQKRLDEVRAQLAVESESRLSLSRQFADTSKQLLESNQLRAMKDHELNEMRLVLQTLEQKIKDSDMLKAQDEIDDNYSVTVDKVIQESGVQEDNEEVELDGDIYSFDMTRESAFSSICEEGEVSVSSITEEVLVDTSMDKVKLQMQVDFLKNEVTRARRSIERQRQRTAQAKAENSMHSKLQMEKTSEDRSRSQRIDERALMAAESAASAALAAEKAVTAVLEMTKDRSVAFANMKNASQEVEACKLECQDFKARHEATSSMLLHDAEAKVDSLKDEADNATSELKATKTELSKALSSIESEKQSQADRQKKRAKELALKKKKWLSEIENAKASNTKEPLKESKQEKVEVDTHTTIAKIDEQKELNEKRIEDIECKLNKPHLKQHSKRWEQALKMQAEHHAANMKMLAAYKQQALKLSNAQLQVDSLKARIQEAEKQLESNHCNSELVASLRAQLGEALKAKQEAEGKLEEAAEEYFKKDKEVEESMESVRNEYVMKLQEAQDREAEAQLKANAADVAAQAAHQAVQDAKQEFREANEALKKELMESKESALNVEAANADQRVALLDHSSRLEEAVSALSVQLQEAQMAVEDAKKHSIEGSEEMLNQLKEELLAVNKAKLESEEIAAESEDAREFMAGRIKELETEISRLTTQLTVTELEGKEAAEEEISALVKELEEARIASSQASTYATEESQYHAALKGQVSTLEANIAYLSIELHHANEFIEKESNLRQGAESEAEQMRREVIKASNHVNGLTAQLYESSEANKVARLAIIQAENETSEAREAVELMSLKLSQSELKESELVKMVEAAKQEVNGLVSDFETFSLQQEKSEEKIKQDANNDYVNLSNKITEAEGELVDLKAQLSSALEARVECENLLAEREAALSRAEVEMVNRANTSREYAACTLKERVELIEKNEELGNVIDTLSGELEELKNIYENKLNEVNSDSSHKEATMIKQYEDQRNSHKSAMEELEVTINLLKEQLTQSEEAAQLAIEDVWMKAETASSEMARDVEIETKREICELERKLLESQTLLVEYEEQVATSDNKIKELETEISRLTTQLTVTELEGKEAAEEEIGMLRRELADAQDASSQAVEYAEIEAQHKSILQTKVDQLELNISELNDRLVALQLAEVETAEVSNAARILDDIAADAKLEKLLTRVNKMELILEEAEAVEQGLIAELQNRELEMEEMDQDIDSVSMRAAGAEMMLEDVSTQLLNEVAGRRQAEAALSVISEEVEELRCQFAEASSAGNAREAEMSIIRRKMSLEMNNSIAMAATQVGMCAASAKIAEIRSMKIEENQVSLSTMVTHTESMAIGQLAKLENKVKETQRIVTVRDAKIRSLQASLSEASAERQKAETELSRAVEMHETRMSALKKELERAEESQLERDNRDRILMTTPKRVIQAPAPVPTSKPPSEVRSDVKTQSLKKVTPRLSSGRKGRDVEKDTHALREANKKLHEHVQQGRSALAAVSAMRARRQASKTAAKPPLAQPSQPVVATQSRLAERVAEKAKTTVVVMSTPKQLNQGSPINSSQVMEDKENIRAVENSGSVKKTPSRLLRRLSLLSPESVTKKSSSFKTPKSQRRTRTPLRDSLVL